MPMDTHEVRVDDRGRVVIPSEIREHVGSPSFFIARLSEEDTVELVPAQLEPASGE
jgi:bifunctional DNA-binding transcriptional regulator/antitoxin component of YhaV-PrlF toxin-antitoxin module